MPKLSRAAVWACAIFLAVAFGSIGRWKLGGTSALRWAALFAQWGYPAGTQYVIGVLEILGGVGVLIPKLRRGAAMLLVIVMLGAVATHLVHLEFMRVIPPLVLGGIAFALWRLESASASSVRLD